MQIPKNPLAEPAGFAEKKVFRIQFPDATIQVSNQQRKTSNQQLSFFASSGANLKA